MKRSIKTLTAALSAKKYSKSSRMSPGVPQREAVQPEVIRESLMEKRKVTRTLKECGAGRGRRAGGREGGRAGEL